MRHQFRIASCTCERVLLSLVYSPDRQCLIRKPVAQSFDEARPLVASGENDRGLEPEPDEPTGDDMEFPAPADTEIPSRHSLVAPCHHDTLARSQIAAYTVL